MRVLVTGATGFVGRGTCAALLARGHQVRAAVRGAGAGLPPGVERAKVGDLGPTTEWGQALTGVEGIIHLAARVHQMHDQSPDPLAAHRLVNRDGTARLARAAAAAGVRRLVFTSSVKVLGEEREAPYTERDVPTPSDPYGLSKWEAEKALGEIAAATLLEHVVLRPPLVYGPGVRANFLRLLQLVDRGVPLPLGSVANRRSFVFVDNLAETLCLALEHPAAKGRAFLVSDDDDVSTAELLRRLAAALGRRARLVPVPPRLLRLAATLLGRQAVADRLLSSLTVSTAALRAELGWRPAFTMSEGLALTADWYRGR